MKKFLILSYFFSNIALANSSMTEKYCYTVQGMTCSTCELTIKRVLKKIPGVRGTTVSYERKLVTVEVETQSTSSKTIQNSIDDIGYKTKSINCEIK